MPKYDLTYDAAKGIFPSIWLGQSPNVGKPYLHSPRIGVMHFTGGDSFDGTVSWLKDPKSEVSAHFVIDRDGRIGQLVSLKTTAWHAGKSSWKNMAGMNSFSWGIEFCNWGGLAGSKAAGWKTPYGRPYTGPAPYIDERGRPWEPYPDEQIQAGLDLVAAIAAVLPTDELVGHSDIAPGRKVDPGPAFPWDRFRALLGTQPIVSKKTGGFVVTAKSLNVRTGPGTNHGVICTLRDGDAVSVDAVVDGWAKVSAPVSGYVSASYIGAVS